VGLVSGYVKDKVNQEESEQEEVDGMKEEADVTDMLMYIEKSSWLLVMSIERV